MGAQGGHKFHWGPRRPPLAPLEIAPVTGASNADGVIGMRHEIAILSLYLASLRSVNAAGTGQVLSIRRRRTTIPQVVTLRIAGSRPKGRL